MNVRRFLRLLRTRCSILLAVQLLLSGAPAGADGLRILAWNMNPSGRIQTYTAAGLKDGEPVLAPGIPAEGLQATLIPTLSDVYLVKKVDGSEIFVRDYSIKTSQRAQAPSKVCNSPSEQNGNNERRVNGVAVRCKSDSSP